LTVIPLEDLKHCQKSGETSMSEFDMLENHVRISTEEKCELDGTTLYGSLTASYLILESLFPSKDENKPIFIYTKAQSRYLKQQISLHQQLHIYPIYSSGTIILVPVFLLFASIRHTELDQLESSFLRSLRTRFDTFTIEQNEEEIDTMDDDVLGQDGEEVSSCDYQGDISTISTATVPLDFMELHRLRTGTFIGKFIYGTPSFNNIFLPALLYAISFGAGTICS
jgi:hypothetical protein